MGCACTLPAHTEFFIHQCPQIPLHRAPSLLPPQPWVAVTRLQDLALAPGKGSLHHRSGSPGRSGTVPAAPAARPGPGGRAPAARALPAPAARLCSPPSDGRAAAAGAAGGSAGVDCQGCGGRPCGKRGSGESDPPQSRPAGTSEGKRLGHDTSAAGGCCGEPGASPAPGKSPSVGPPLDPAW